MVAVESKIQSATNRVLKLVGPAAAFKEAFGRPLSRGLAGGPGAVASYYKDEVIPNWHGPTLEGFFNALGGGLGAGIVNTFFGMGVKFVGDVAGVQVVKTIGSAIQDGGEGQALGGLADMVIHAHEFNPGDSGGRHGGSRSAGWHSKDKGKGRAKVSTAPGIGRAHSGAPKGFKFR
jgi:hypothetical protein